MISSRTWRRGNTGMISVISWWWWSCSGMWNYRNATRRWVTVMLYCWWHSISIRTAWTYRNATWCCLSVCSAASCSIHCCSNNSAVLTYKAEDVCVAIDLNKHRYDEVKKMYKLLTWFTVLNQKSASLVHGFKPQTSPYPEQWQDDDREVTTPFHSDDCHSFLDGAEASIWFMWEYYSGVSMNTDKHQTQYIVSHTHILHVGSNLAIHYVKEWFS